MDHFKWLKRALFFGLLLGHGLLFAQNMTQGEVLDEYGNPVKGGTVRVVGQSTHVQTDDQGQFQLEALPPGTKLSITYIGYESKVVVVDGGGKLRVILSTEEQMLEEVVAIGYGTLRRKDVTGSISSVSAKDLTVRPGATIHQALQGKAAGVVVQQNNGSPGGTTQIRIRGTNSILGDSNPMWVIDGFPVSDANGLNLADVESIDILKDASATAIYGSRAAGGVILVTTKKGKAGKSKVTYDGKFTSQSLIKKLDLLDAQGYMKLINLQLESDGKAAHFSQSEIESAGKGIDWQDLIYQTAPLHEHSLSLSGGNDVTKYAFGGTYFSQDGLIKGSNYDRISTRLSLDHKISKVFSVAGNTILSRSMSNASGGVGGFRGSTVISSSIVAPPTVGPYMEDGIYRMLSHEYPFSVSSLRNPVAYMNEVSDYTLRNRIMSNLAIRVNLMEGLTWETSANVQNNEYRNDSYVSTKYPQSEGKANISLANTAEVSTTNTLSYTFNKANHNLNAMIGTSYENWVYKPVTAGSQNFLVDNGGTYDLGAANDFNIKPSSNYRRSDLLSFFGRVNYSYDDRYLATFTLRRDGSSKYTEKWGNFPSAAIAWRLSNERFMKDVKGISDLKIRLGYGMTGNPAIDPYTTIRLLTAVYANVNKTQEVGFDPRESYPGDLNWEMQEQINIGLDLSLFNHRVNFTADYYRKTTRDLLNQVQMPLSSGYNYTVQNIGSMQNNGLELQLSGDLIRTTNLRWNLSANLSYNENKVLELYGDQMIMGSNYNQLWVSDYVNVVAEGHPLGSFYGYRSAGYDELGNMLYFKGNGDVVQASGLRAEDDRTFIGNPNPKWTYGINTSVDYKAFTLGIFAQGVNKRDIFSFSMGSTNFDYGYGLNTFKEVLTDHWTIDNPNAKYPAMKGNNPYVISDRFIYSGSYFRIKNIELAYRLNTQNLNIKWMNGLQIYGSLQNPFTITEYPWYDPDVNSRGGSKSINQGIDDYSYPTAKSYTIGLRMDF